jgi:hypothetical protein
MVCSRRGILGLGLTAEIGDYDKVRAQYTRSFLWTRPLYYAAVQYVLVQSDKRKMEKVAGSFDENMKGMNTRAAMVRVRV